MGKRMSLKLFLRNLFSLIRQSLNLPHNKTRRQVIAAKAAFDLQEIESQRVHLIAQATKQLETVITNYTEEAKQLSLSGEKEGGKIWNVRGAMMSKRDRVTLYALVRALRPVVCIETGCAGGSSATFILSALSKNGDGNLVSIEIQSPHKHEYGSLIPNNLRQRWSLRVEQDKPVLPDLLDVMKNIDFFLHDSNHSYKQMTWEYELAWRYLKSGGCLASHDVVTTSAFGDFQRNHLGAISAMGVIGNFGFFIKR